MNNWLSEHKETVLIVGGILLVVALIVALVVIFYEPPLDVGTITSLQSTADQVTYRQKYENKYRYVTKYRTVDVKDDDGKKIGTKEESYRDRVFDHKEYYIERFVNVADFVVTIEGQSQKHPEKMRTSTIYVSKDRFSSFQKGNTFVYTKELGDSRSDNNNTTIELERQWYSPFNMAEWCGAHNIDINDPNVKIENDKSFDIQDTGTGFTDSLF